MVKNESSQGLFTLHALRDVREGGQLGSSAPALPWTSSLAQQRTAFTSKTGWVNPDDPDMSVGIIVHGYTQSIDARLGPVPLGSRQFLDGTQRGGGKKQSGRLRNLDHCAVMARRRARRNIARRLFDRRQTG